MAKESELEIVCRHILSILANALAGAAPINKDIIDISSAKKKLSILRKHQEANSMKAIQSETD